MDKDVKKKEFKNEFDNKGTYVIKKDEYKEQTDGKGRQVGTVTKWNKKESSNFSDIDETRDDYSLYTEKIVPSPIRKYKSIIKFAHFLGMALVFTVVVCFGIVFGVPYIRSMFGLDKPEEKERVVFERDEISMADPANNQGEIRNQANDNNGDANIRGDYEDVINQLKSKVEDIKTSMVQVGNEGTDKSELLGDEKTDLTAGIIIAKVNSEYIMLTDYSVVGDEENVEIFFQDNTKATAEVMCGNEDTGICLVKVDERYISNYTRNVLTVIQFDNSYNISQGDMVIIAGKLYSNPAAVDYGTISSISNVLGTDNVYSVLDTNIMCNPKDYGFIFSGNGKLVGISNPKSENATVSMLGISNLKAQIESLINNKGVMYLGIKGETVTTTLAEKYSLPKGIYVSRVESGSPAFEAGIQEGDVICEFDGKEILTIQALSEKLYQCNSGQLVEISVKRLGKEEYSEISFVSHLDFIKK